MSIATRVDLGFAAETAFLGPEWVKDFDTSTLDMESLIHCILGKNHGSFRQGLTDLRLDYQAAVDHGFNAGEEQYSSLRSAWVTRIWAAQKELEG